MSEWPNLFNFLALFVLRLSKVTGDIEASAFRGGHLEIAHDRCHSLRSETGVDQLDAHFNRSPWIFRTK